MALTTEATQALHIVLSKTSMTNVITYGNLAREIGLPRGARQIAKALKALPSDTQLPWHRVVGAGPRVTTPPDSKVGQLQRQLLRREGWKILPSGRLVRAEIPDESSAP